MVVKLTFYIPTKISFQFRIIYVLLFLHKILNSWMLKFLISFYTKNQLNVKLKLFKLYKCIFMFILKKSRELENGKRAQSESVVYG